MRITLFLSVLICFSCARIPKGSEGEEADALTKKVWKATGQQNWKDSKVVKWNFDNNHNHIWDRDRNLIKVSWDDIVVFENLNTREGVVLKKGEELSGKKKDNYLKKAAKYWGNDSYWLNPFWKFFEDGVERRLVHYEGEDALLITHTTGGNTPGDTFLWLIDESGLPYAWKLWVKIIPIKGFRMGWSNWIKLPNGLKISKSHKSTFTEITITDITIGETIDEVFPDKDPFAVLLTP